MNDMTENPTFSIEDIGTDVRIDVLQRLAEQAMSDLDFRAVARHDLEGALRQFGYDLNDSEMELVLAFRRSLADAGIDLFLEERITAEQLEAIHQLFG
jgi:hypothetical protein